MSRKFHISWSLLAPILICCVVPALEAQPLDPFLVPTASSSAAYLLQKASALEKQEHWAEAAECYRKVLTNYADRLVQVEESPEHRLYQNAGDVALQQMAKLAGPARELCRARILSDSPSRFAEGSGPSELAKLLLSDKVRGKFLAAIDRSILEERYPEALRYIGEFWKYKNLFAGEDLSREILAREGFCHYALADKTALRALFAKCEDGVVTNCGKQEKIADYLQQLLTQIEARADVLDQDGDWPLYGKNLAHNGGSGEALTDLGERLSIPIPIAARKDSSTYYSNEAFRNVQGPCPYYPVIGNDTIFVNNGKEIFAYDLYSGELKWRYNGLVSILKSNFHEQVIHSAMYHDGALYVNIEGDTPTQRADAWANFQISAIIPEKRLVKLDAATGNFLWQVRDARGDEESFGNKASFMTPPVMWGSSLYVGATELRGLFNSYAVAVSPEDGRILWKTLIGSAQQELNMFGRPVREAVGGMVAVGNGTLFHLNNLGACCSLDPFTGRLLWVYVYDRIPTPRTQQALYRTPYREPSWYHSPVVTAGDSVYVAPLDSTSLYCLDAVTGRKKWSRNRGNQLYLLTVADGKVILGGNCLELLDAQSGSTVKIIPLYRKVSGFGIVTDQHFYCPTSGYLYCVDLKKQSFQRTKWPGDYDENEWDDRDEEAGHIVVADSVLVLSRFTQGEQKSGYLSIFCDTRKLRSKWEKQIQKTPQSPAPLLKLARLYRHIDRGHSSGDIEDLYLKGFQLARDFPDVNRRQYLVRAMQGLAQIYLRSAQEREIRGEFSEAHSCYEKALQYVEDPDTVVAILFRELFYYQRLRKYEEMERCTGDLLLHYGDRSYWDPVTKTAYPVSVHALALQAKYCEDSERPRQAVQIYQNILRQYSDSEYEGTTAHKWAVRQINSLLERHDREKIYGEYDRACFEEYRSAVTKGGGSAEFLRIVQSYPNSKYLPEIQMERAKFLIRENKVRDAVEELRFLIREHAGSASTAEAYQLMVVCYEQMKMYTAAKNCLTQMAIHCKNSILSIDDRAVPVKEFVQERLNRPVYADIQIMVVPYLELWDTDKPKHEIPFEYSRNLLRLLEIQGYPAPRYEHLVFLNLGADQFLEDPQKGILYCYDGGTGNLNWKSQLGWVRRVGFANGRLFAWGNYRIFALNPEDGSVLWESSVLDRAKEKEEDYRMVSLTLGKNVIACVCAYHNKRGYSTVVVRQADTGDPVWSANFPGNEPEDLLLGHQTLIAYSKKPSVAYIYDLSRGTLVKRLEDPGDTTGYYPLLLSDNYLCLVRGERWIDCYQLPSLNLLWSYDGTAISVKSIAGNEEYLCFVREDNRTVVLDLVTGNVQWTCPLPENGKVHKFIPDADSLYYLEKSGARGENLYLVALDNGFRKWETPITDEFHRVTIYPFLTQRYILVLKNRSVEGIQSILTVYDKFNGKQLRYYEVKRGNRGRTESSLCIRAGNLWLIKDNICWVLGK